MAGQSLADRMAAAADGVKVTDTYFCEVLDFSEASVAAIERVSDDVGYALPDGKTPANVELLCRVWGAYLGEAFRRNVGGEWVAWEDEHGRATALRSGGVTVFPHDKVRKRLAGGAEHDLRDYYQVFRDRMSAGR